MPTIWKFPIPDTGWVEIPEGARVLSAGVQREQQIVIWAMVDPEAPKVRRLFTVYGTGREIPAYGRNASFVGTVFIGPFVFHVFDQEVFLE